MTQARHERAFPLDLRLAYLHGGITRRMHDPLSGLPCAAPTELSCPEAVFASLE
jgi:hypothetical protein